VLQAGAGGTYPIPLTWVSPCANASGTGTLTAAWDSVELSATSAACATLIELAGPAGSTVTLIWQSG
jgi:hypothetical protein